MQFLSPLIEILDCQSHNQLDDGYFRFIFVTGMRSGSDTGKT
jgi:hypothetical protein